MSSPNRAGASASGAAGTSEPCTGLGARVVLALLRLYREGISPLRPACCRYTPSCSAYAVEAIGTYGVGRGGWLALLRLLRCHPFHAGGHDPVPPRVEAADRPSTPRVNAMPAA